MKEGWFIFRVALRHHWGMPERISRSTQGRSLIDRAVTVVSAKRKLHRGTLRMRARRRGGAERIATVGAERNGARGWLRGGVGAHASPLGGAWVESNVDLGRLHARKRKSVRGHAVQLH
jgi:hypothetical protein